MVDVLDLLEKSKAQGERVRCLTCIWLASRPEEERTKWIEAIEQPKTWDHTAIARAMSQVAQPDGAPKPPSWHSVSNHRIGHVKGKR